MTKQLILLSLLLITGITHAQKYKFIQESTKTRQATVKFEKPVIIKWLSPSTYSPTYSRNTNFEIALMIESKSAVNSSDIQIYLNDKLYQSKSGEEELMKMKKSDVRRYKFSSRIEQIGHPDQTRVRILYVPDYGKSYESSTMVINHNGNAQRARLHLFAVGIGKYNELSDLQNLNYPVQDAKDFYTIMDNETALFKGIRKVGKGILTNELANSANIVAQINTISQDFQEHEIKPEDILVIFISSHGVMVDGEFCIASSDYRKKAASKSTVNFRKEIILPLKEVNCKKIIFLDACFSGGARIASKANDEDVSAAISKIMSTNPGVTIIASSSEGERSYEIPKYQHGSFTQALIEGLQGKANTDNNTYIDLDELFDYIKNRVPKLNHEANKPAQHPTRSSNELKGLPIKTID